MSGGASERNNSVSGEAGYVMHLDIDGKDGRLDQCGIEQFGRAESDIDQADRRVLGAIPGSAALARKAE